MELSLPFAARPRRKHAASGKRSRRAHASVGERALAWLPSGTLALRTTLCTLIALPLLGGGWLWLRNSSLVAVRHVHISGVHGAEAIQIRTALDSVAAHMTTMDFDAGKLRAAAAPFMVVAGLHVTTSFPHTVRISVTERMPVAAFFAHGQSTAVAADGTVLGPALLSSSLPQVAGSLEPRTGSRLRAAALLADVAVIGAAPSSIARYIARVFEGREGLTVAMRNGLLVYFGDATRPHAKWLSLARVLVSSSSAGAVYVDVRLPERPAAGMSSESPSATPSAALSVGSSEPTTAALAASLSNAVGGGSSAPSSTSGSGESEATSTESEAAAGESEASSTGSEAGSTGSEAPATQSEASAGQSEGSPEQ